MKKRLTVIVNENHTLLPEQERILKEMFPDLEPEFLFAPATGWTKRDSVMPHEDVTRDPYRALAYCQGVLEILQSHYLAWCKSAVSQGNTELAAQNLDLVESCCGLLAKTIAGTLEKMAKGAIPWPQKWSGS